MDRVILVVSEDRCLVRDVRRLLGSEPLHFMRVEPGRTEVDVAGPMPVGAVLVDGRLSEALEQVRVVKAAEPDVPVILVASTYSGQQEILVRRLGAFYSIVDTDTGEYGNLHRFLLQVSKLQGK